MPLKFCPKCKSIMVLAKINGKSVYRCPKCGYVEEVDPSSKHVERMVIERKASDDPIVLEDAGSSLPKIKAYCPKCGNDEAYYWVQQTRAADEPPTRFYRCTRCGYSWREYE
ncbi:transcription factor S [Thermocladium modestius]|uniref:Transcription factor S n=1 Tax=Thermocladium modestius TaxID=62609 RepID=A0A830GY68_9CREN|nr:transcription factor S [Thermocladium modestius]